MITFMIGRDDEARIRPERFEEICERAALAVQEIRDDFRNGDLDFDPPTTFVELHDFVDANCYGGMCADDCSLTIAEANLCQNLINCALAAGII